MHRPTDEHAPEPAPEYALEHDRHRPGSGPAVGGSPARSTDRHPASPTPGTQPTVPADPGDGPPPHGAPEDTPNRAAPAAGITAPADGAAPPCPAPAASDMRARARTGARLSLGGGTALGIAGVGAVLAFVDLSPPLRAPFTLFFLVVAPAAAISSALHGVDPLSRPVLAVPGALVLDLLVAQALLALHAWSARAGVVTVGALSLTLHLFTCVRRTRRTRREPAEGRARGEARPGTDGGVAGS
ncbi:hypothetical protein ACMA1D_16620 [Streptomyces sp. 796.1]|uniref:hypothetical protein n=1 Tax=Streptomyces sp. 796.1 TaxID=3163029 RepID=UPI0039C96A1E